MSAKDLYHELIKAALVEEGWQITHDPYRIDLKFTDLYIDLGAERLLAAEKDREKIAIEIKSFLASSTISEFHSAIGQFVNYRLALEDEDPDRQLYLAVPEDIYKQFFSYAFIQKSISRNQVPLIVYSSLAPEIVLWTS